MKRHFLFLLVSILLHQKEAGMEADLHNHLFLKVVVHQTFHCMAKKEAVIGITETISIVALSVAGGGGGAALDGYKKWAAGCGGGLNGENSNYKSCPIQGGGQIFVAINNDRVSNDQGFGVGGWNTPSPLSGGGSGWYGGCANNALGGWGAGAAGGSGYTYNSSTASNYPSGCKLNSSFYLTESKTLAGNKKFPNCSGNGQEKGHSGNGYAKITPL